MSTRFDIPVYKDHLYTQWLGHSVSYVDELESTNTHLKRLPKEKVTQGMLCLTDHQIKGRGQYDRKWESEIGKNLTFSIGFQPPSSDGFHVLTLACALAIVEHVNEILGRPVARIKWPNDVLVKDKKVAGLLTETVFNGNKLDRLIIGIGMNINQNHFSPGLEQKATSVCLQTGTECNREKFLGELLQRIEQKYYLWQRRREELVRSINRTIIGYGSWVSLTIDDELQDETYKMLGINESGKLLMLDQEGSIKSFSYEQIRVVTD